MLSFPFSLGLISSRYGSAVVYPPANYGWMTGPYRLSVTSHRVFMQFTMRVERMVEFVTPQKIKPVSRDVFYAGIFWIVQGKA